MSNPADLNITPQPDTDKNFFNFKAVGLKIDKTYAIKFQWIYENDTKSDWSPGFFVNTSTESVPAAPTNTVTGGAGFIKIELPTFPANALRVDVRIAGGTFGSGTVVAESFTSAGVKTIAALGAASPGNAYIVTLLTVTPSKINGDPSSPVTVYVTDPAASIAVEPSVTPSTPTVSQVLGAIQLSWNGKRSDGTDQPVGFKAAKVYIGTSAGFTPVDTGTAGANQVDVLNFSNGQNTLNISVGTIVNAVALTYGTDYYVKIKTTNGNVAQDSSAVSATGNPVRIGQVGSGDIVSVTADKIYSGTISSQTITVGSPGGKRVELRGSGNPFEIFGTGGTSLLSYNTGDTKLNITGDGSFTGNITGASGTIGGITLNSSGISSTNFSISSTGIITATSGTIGGWTITGSVIESPLVSNNRITFNPATPKIALLQSGVEKITIDPVEGIKDSTGNFALTPAGNLTIKGQVQATSGYFGSSGINWTIGNNGITASGNALIDMGNIGKIKMGNYQIWSESGAGFRVYDGSGNIISVSDVSGASDPGRLFLGQAAGTGVTERQTEVAKNAQVSGTASIYSEASSISAYRSGGLRNMYTVSDGNYQAGSMYPDAGNGSVLLVYTV
jgi:hypothetical protein